MNNLNWEQQAKAMQRTALKWRDAYFKSSIEGLLEKEIETYKAIEEGKASDLASFLLSECIEILKDDVANFVDDNMDRMLQKQKQDKIDCERSEFKREYGNGIHGH